MNMRLESADHRRLSIAWMLLVAVMAAVFAVRLQGVARDGIDLFFGFVIVGLAATALAYAVCSVRLIDGGVLVRNGPRSHRIRSTDIVGVGRMQLGSRLAPAAEHRSGTSYLVLELASGVEVVCYGLSWETSLRRRSDGPDALDQLEARLRAHCGLEPAAP